MKDFITEAWLRANHTLSEGAEIHLPADSRLTPSARELLESRHLRIKFIDEQGRLFVDDEQQQPQPVHGLTSSDEHPQACCELCRQAIVGLSDEDLHRLSHQPLRYLGHDHLVPEASHGRDAALLNLLRTKVREAETVAAQVFITRSFEVLRPDILQALNRLSSTVYVMMILSVTKQPLTVKQIQQRLGETQ
ncbi:hypothetical protein C0M66_000411 [Escherichia coli]|nr:hypothetical protein [Escherichia coli]